MNQWLGKAAALVFIKNPGLWGVLNSVSELILWTDDASDAAWYFHEIQPREARPAPTRKKKYKRGAYGLPPKWRRAELAAQRVAEMR
jgi:hypothetical protein